jgi:hypothetical protein
MGIISEEYAMRALWWLILSFLFYIGANRLADWVAAEMTVDLGVLINGVGIILFILIWTLMLSQGIFTRIHRALGYLVFNLGIAVCIFLASFVISEILYMLNAETGDVRVRRITFLIGIIITILVFLQAIVMLAIKRHRRTWFWKILETNKFVSPEPGYQSRTGDIAAEPPTI